MLEISQVLVEDFEEFILDNLAIIDEDMEPYQHSPRIGYDLRNARTESQ